MGMPATTAWTVEELWTLPDDGQRREIIDGELFVSPSPAWSHQEIADELAHALREYLRRHRFAKVLTAPADVVFGPRTLVQPDILVVPLVEGRMPRDYQDAGRLLIAAEVLSPGTARRDRGVKRLLYQRENVAEYWIVDADARLIERWRPGDERPEVITIRMEWNPSGAAEPFLLDVQEFFASVGE
ncbi:MAG: Uma2 family endonuclease [Gemmatimonadaceae bacterium]|nr:Uma2 family endonuclease [Gemmatimonadaceae bacterium]